MKEGKMCGICKLVVLVAGIGALNWGLVAVADFDIIARLLGPMTTASRIAYGIIGLAGLGLLVSLVKCCPCGKDGSCS